ncbi:hypothetical protein [Bacillus solitudinis]|uniref:hypothetical protein n=1 Tax=Bacillus solitudinis TaxID=2014074 RepID=UPI000C24082F|nr:hypothetical protein [Bacillus solitudinis]
MKRSGKAVGGFILILIGISLIFSLIGVHLGGLIGIALGVGGLYWGFSIYRERGRWSFSSIVLIVIGAMILFGGLGGIISLVIGAGLVYGGYRLIKPRQEEELDLSDDTEWAKPVSTYDSIDEEFARLMKNNK